MKKVVVDGFELTDEYIKRLLFDLKNDKVKNEDDLNTYLKNHWYTKDNQTKSHLLLDKYNKKRNFALPFDEEK